MKHTHTTHTHTPALAIGGRGRAIPSALKLAAFTSTLAINFGLSRAQLLGGLGVDQRSTFNLLARPFEQSISSLIYLWDLHGFYLFRPLFYIFLTFLVSSYF
jgi:hypothetical protein